MEKYTIKIETIIDLGLVEGFNELYKKHKDDLIATHNPKQDDYYKITIHEYIFEFEDIEKYAWFNNSLVNIIIDYRYKKSKS